MTSQQTQGTQSIPMAAAWAGAIVALALEFHHPIHTNMAVAGLVTAIVVLFLVSRTTSRAIILPCCVLLGVCFTSISYYLTLKM